MEKSITVNWISELETSHQDVIEKLMSLDPYALLNEEKRELLSIGLKRLVEYHIANNLQYRNILKVMDYSSGEGFNITDLPMLPVRIFKELSLFTNPENGTLKTVTSSGTSSQLTSKIFIDSETAALQVKTLVKIVGSYIGTQRLPMLIVDSPNTVGNRNIFSARAAGILGFTKFSKGITYALNSDMSPNWQAIEEYALANKDNKSIVFGFTSIIWIHLISEMKKNNIEYGLENAKLFHGGGWKKLLETEQVDGKQFKEEMRKSLGITQIHDYYGMAEQTGSILIECELGYMHTSIFSDLIIRNPLDYSVCEIGRIGLIESVSILPKSYPGHLLLTEDLGKQIGVDDCKCGRLGSYFLIIGRIKSAELRGCSDTYQNA